MGRFNAARGAGRVGCACMVLGLFAGTAFAQFATVTSFSRSTTGSSFAVAGSTTNGPTPLNSGSTTWAPLAFGTILAPSAATAIDNACAPNGALSQSSARVDQFIGITSPNDFRIASTVYGIANTSVHPCSTLTASGSGSTNGSWQLAFSVLTPTTLTLSRANAAFTAGNAPSANATITYTLAGPSGSIASETLATTLPTEQLNSSGSANFTLLPGAHNLNVTLSAGMSATGNALATTGGTAFAAFDLRFQFGPAGPICDSIDFNNDGLFPDTADLDDFLSVFGGGACSNDPNCNDIDFNNDGLFPDTADLDSLLSIFGGGPCI